MWGGWFSDPKLLSILGKSKQLFTEYPQKIGIEMQPEVCLFIDEQLQFWDMSYGSLTEQIYSNRYPLGKVGTPHDIYLRTDFANISTDQYKVIWLMGFLKLKDAEVQRVREWQKQGKIVLWTDGDGTHKYSASSEDYIDKFKQFSDSQLRDIFKNAGVHIYSDSGDVFYIGRNWLCIHTIFGGKKTINLPFFAKVINAINDQKYSDSTNLIEIEMSSKSTVLLYIDPI
jgi:beta-galactosidase